MELVEEGEGRADRGQITIMSLYKYFSSGVGEGITLAAEAYSPVGFSLLFHSFLLLGC